MSLGLGAIIEVLDAQIPAQGEPWQPCHSPPPDTCHTEDSVEYLPTPILTIRGEEGGSNDPRRSAKRKSKQSVIHNNQQESYKAHGAPANPGPPLHNI